MDPFVGDNDGLAASHLDPTPPTLPLEIIRRKALPLATTNETSTGSNVSSLSPDDRLQHQHEHLESHWNSSEGRHKSPESPHLTSDNDGANESSILWNSDDGAGLQSAQPPRRCSGGLAVHLKSWAPETSCCLLTVMILVALAVVLSMYDRKPLPQWPLGLTLNTIVALLATLCRSLIVIPIAEGISQLKWNWFAVHQRSIRSLYIFDQASRGPWGALRLIFTTMNGRLMPLSLLASIVLISSLTTSFLTQSVIAFSTRQVTTEHRGSAITKQVKAFPSYSGARSSFDDSQQLLKTLRRELYQGVFVHVGDNATDADPTCPSGDCSWPEFSSLGVCVTMSNITDGLVIEEEEKSWSSEFTGYFPNSGRYLIQDDMWEPGLNMSTTSQYSLLVGIEPFAEWKNSNLVDAGFAESVIIFTNPVPDHDTIFRAVALLWHFCVHTYKITVVDGVASTQIVETETRVESDDIAIDSSDVHLRGLSLSNAARTEAFNITSGGPHGPTNLNEMFEFGFNDGYSHVYEGDRVNVVMEQISSNLYEGIALEGTVEDGDAKLWRNIESLSRNIAQSLTTSLRRTDPDNQISGDVFTSETFIVVRWEWMSFIVAQVSLAIIFLLAIMINTARMNVSIVKSSNLAELFAIRGRTEHITGDKGSMELDSIQPTLSNGLVGKLKREEDGRWNLELQRKDIENKM